MRNKTPKIVAFKFKLKPTKEQEDYLMRMFGCARKVFNLALSLCIHHRNRFKKEDPRSRVPFKDMSAMLTRLKHTKANAYLNDVPAVILQQSIRNLYDAFKFCALCKNKFPKFKSKWKSRTGIHFPTGVSVDLSDPKKWFVRIPCPATNKKLDTRIRICHNFVKELQGLDTLPGNIKSATIKRTPAGEFFISINVEIDFEVLPKTKVELLKLLALDMGIKDFAVASDGRKINIPKTPKRESKHLAALQRAYERAKPGSKHRENLRRRMAKLYQHIADRREDHINKLVDELAKDKRYTAFGLESLDIEGMLMKGKRNKLSGAISDSGWGMFTRKLIWKAGLNGKQVIQIGQYFPSTKRCSQCGHTLDNISLGEREWTCPTCGVHHDRDLNAAINIQREAFRLACGGEDGERPAVNGQDGHEAHVCA